MCWPQALLPSACLRASAFNLIVVTDTDNLLSNPLQRIMEERPTPSVPDVSSEHGDARQAKVPSSETFRLMIDAVRDYGIFMLNPSGHIVSWNAGAERIKGYRADEVIGRHFSVFYPEDAIERGWPAHELKMALADGRFEDEGWRVRKNGSRFWANVVITSLFDEVGRHVGFTKVTRDLTERRSYEQALRMSEERLARANEELERKNRDLQEFAFVAGHDLQEPLRKINTFGEILEAEYRDALGENGRLYVDRMRVSAQRMSELVRDLLAYSRLSTRREPFEPVDLGRIVVEVLGDLQILLDESGGDVEIGPMPVIAADPMQMRQLFQNLIGNALKFRRPGVQPRVRVALERDDREQNVLVFVVEDNGVGFEERNLERIFDPFQRLHSRSEFEGTGLGLSICRRIVERHQGSITATSMPGEGSVFIVTLAREPAESSTTQAWM